MVQLSVVGLLCVIFALRLLADSERLQMWANHTGDLAMLGLGRDFASSGVSLAERFLKTFYSHR